jgi:hypothetical protein
VQVTKLCDLSPGDSVCSVSWSQRGTYLSVGTNSGEVQVRLRFEKHSDDATCPSYSGMHFRSFSGHQQRGGAGGH